MKAKLSIRIQIGVFLSFIGLLFLGNLLLPDRAFSDFENRTLATRPALTLSSLFAGQFTKDYETYITDQFPLRDTWVSLKGYTEAGLLKKENNGVYLAADQTLISRFDPPDFDRVDANLRAVNRLASLVDVPVYLSIIPSAACIWEDRLPAFAPIYNQRELIAYIYDRSEAATVDMTSVLLAQKDQPLYYRTDHHWTSLGAYYGYTALIQALDRTPAALDSFHCRTVSRSFYGTLYAKAGARWIAPDTIETFVDDAGIEVTVYEKDMATPGALYHPEALSKRDQYTYFLGGNHALAVIHTPVKDAPKLLLLRDSYTDSLLPFLTAHFSEIHLIDPRYYKGSTAQYVADAQIDLVIANFSVENFSSDSSIRAVGW